MIPFKEKTNSILKNTAVLIILLCISDSCFSYLQHSRRTTEESRRFVGDYQLQGPAKDQFRRSAAVLQRETLAISPYIRDVRADSRQSRIDARDIRTDFREIRTELHPQARFERESRTDMANGQQDYSRRAETASRDLNNNVRSEESSRTTVDRRDARNIPGNTRQNQNYSQHRLQRQLLDERTRDSSSERREFDSTRRDGRFSREDTNQRQRGNEHRQIREGRLEHAFEDRRDAQEKSRDSRNIRERSDDRRAGFQQRTLSQSLRTDAPNNARQDVQRNELRYIQERSDNRRSIPSRSDDRSEHQDRRRDARNIRDNTRQNQNDSRHRLQRQQLDERTQDSSSERREFDSTRRDGRFSREETNQRQGGNEHRQIRERRLKHAFEDQRNAQEKSRDSSRERSDDRRAGFQQRTPSQLLRTDAPNSGRQDVQRNELRYIQERSDNRRSIPSRFDDRCERQDRREVRQHIQNVQRGSGTNHENRRIREIASERRDRYDTSVEHRNMQQNVQTRLNNIRERSDARANRESSESTRQRQDNRRELDRSDASRESNEGRNNIEVSRNSRAVRLTDSRQMERRELPQKLAEQREPIRTRQGALRERRQFSRNLSEDRKGERTFLLADRRSDESTAEYQGYSRLNTRQHGDRVAESAVNVRDKRQVGRERDDIRSSRRYILNKPEHLDRRERSTRELRELVPESRDIETRNIRDTDSRRHLKDSAARAMKTEPVDFIPNIKEKSEVVSNTIQAVLMMVLFGQIFFSTSKSKLRFSGYPNIFGKEKVF